MNDKEFYQSGIAFIIYQGHIFYLKNSFLSHEEWCSALGINKDLYMKLVRGYIKNNEIVFYQGNFKYNEEVINICIDTYKQIAFDNNLRDYSVYCGVIKGKVGEKWKPILKVK